MKTALLIGICLVMHTDCTTISTSCFSLIQPCISQDLCRSKETLLRNVCVSEESSCQMQSTEGCNVTIQAILAHSRECVCTDENPCSILQLLASLCRSFLDFEPLPAPDKSRLATQQLSSHTNTLHPHSDHHLPFPVHENNLKDERKQIRLLTSDLVPAPDISCVQGMTLCIQDEVCNRQLVPFVQSCSAPHCEERLCRLAAKQFYSSLPENMAEMLVFCPCEQDDHDCQNFQTMLNSNSCKQDHTSQWNCLEMLDNCTGERICRQTFEAFLSKCFGSEDVSLSGYSTIELLHVIDLNFFVSGNKECRLAFVATMGSVLQSLCTCHGLDHHSLYRCNVLQQAIHNRSYFRPQGTKQNISSTKSKDKSHQEHSWLNDQFLYIVVSICVLVVMIIAVAIAIVAHKLGKKHSLSKKPDSRYKPPEDSTKSLDL
ncbi:GDNF family receptor alpha-like [Hemibagrus wyckioides]|uniref:GDNF family receptor alpha-like n=1 Tax=Hemibagrus wyckioides TaxID=337641 RepID=UPI00266BBC9C|nr:GDNF family receptor alpha-like [Hemibagrus wyckioides]XP_058236032.1 GDNF family receptor alpha-like [Hemibagrus wyckioides]